MLKTESADVKFVENIIDGRFRVRDSVNENGAGRLEYVGLDNKK